MTGLLGVPRYYPNRDPQGPQHYILLPQLAGRR
jgi:hypothetical protein